MESLLLRMFDLLFIRGFTRSVVCCFAGGKVLREGMGQATGVPAKAAGMLQLTQLKIRRHMRDRSSGSGSRSSVSQEVET